MEVEKGNKFENVKRKQDRQGCVWIVRSLKYLRGSSLWTSVESTCEKREEIEPYREFRVIRIETEEMKDRFDASPSFLNNSILPSLLLSLQAADYALSLESKKSDEGKQRGRVE